MRLFCMMVSLLLFGTLRPEPGLSLQSRHPSELTTAMQAETNPQLAVDLGSTTATRPEQTSPGWPTGLPGR